MSGQRLWIADKPSRICYYALMILPIYTDKQPVLHQETAPITEITPEIRQLALDMRETLKGAVGIGLAAPQVGKSIALIVIEIDEEDGVVPFMPLVNPRITWKSPRQAEFIEACLSVPGFETTLKRPRKVRVKAQNLDGERVEIDADGLLARVLQHEIDHLHGILYTDLVPKKELKPRPLVQYPQL